ncbi:Phosphoribosylamine--glycine ligase [Austwickia sp. TVS 96-490-7B]|uniref:phosphoribosylamine--glycine ligase n=1 Tax=Austwickia sp. TVS 96-490-7B TaxID=2830843 RepID=UPI001C56E050|nr:phosphoribosylamine--glycine ligase [Austwickia sp. TVS 96-490-7B]MBW3085469.1 Phosphoribosylamine--glycine ligase [Austwickia sp. TVS 96-490-7B]
MKILVVGSGAREHALVHSLAADPQVDGLFAAPGNPGMASSATLCPLADPTDPVAVTALAREVGADLVVIGPEAPLVAGVANAVRESGIACFGPDAAAAALEGSKSFAKDVMAAAGVPTAAARVCTTVDEVAEALDVLGSPYVVKDDGLAAGKGVVVTDNRMTAMAHAAQCLNRPEEATGRMPTVVVEEYLDGPEVSLFCVTDGTSVVPLAPAQDFKRALDGDEGPNTGGMGAYSPLDWAPTDLVAEVVTRIAEPTVAHMRDRGTPFVGILYVGLALTSRGLRVVEFNARFGDPETQVVLARLRTPLGGLLYAAATGTLAAHPPLRWSTDHAVTVVVAAQGYPEGPRKGDPIDGVDQVNEPAYVLHAGTAQSGEQLVSSGGRVLSVVGVGPDLGAARQVAYAAVDVISVRGSHHRRDIALAAEQGQVWVPLPVRD